ncbi:2-phosphosulfolactate phosphatase [Phenylobacterium immobile]|uniref:2-phosphosulfolactate phosphatase n=1 Tax=Phenylobacterium immobile TaxID=21 RepID=UPI000B061844|nr:2-phosphosulfolactate phosphatase [Phenylobacterium immobile]
MADVVCAWGLSAVEAWRDRASALVIVDTLTFSTTVSVAADRGVRVIPYGWGEDFWAAAAAKKADAQLAGPRGGDTPNLSPGSVAAMTSGSRLLLPSRNGGALSVAAGMGSAAVFCGSLRNVSLVAQAASEAAGGGTIAIIAAGEIVPDAGFRPAIEDWFGAGAIIEILHAEGREEDAKAQLARLAYEAAANQLEAVMRDSLSGREVTERGFEGDVDFALQVDQGLTAPRLVDGVFEPGVIARAPVARRNPTVADAGFTLAQ